MTELVMLARDVPPDLMEFFEPIDYGDKHDVFTIATEATPFSHFATFPSKLITPMVLAGCPATVCARCGKPYVREVEVSGGTIGTSWTHDDPVERMMKGMSSVSVPSGTGRLGRAKDANGKPYTRRSLGFAPSCDCRADTRPGIVLDPFMGSGTVALVARRLGRSYIGCDLSSEYVQLAQSRLAEPYTPPMPLDVPAPAPVAAVQEALL